MPAISSFHGVVVSMDAAGHSIPHFHARFGEHTAKVGIADAEVLRGYLPPRVRRTIRHWARLHRVELVENWGRLCLGLPPLPIEPLP